MRTLTHGTLLNSGAHYQVYRSSDPYANEVVRITSNRNHLYAQSRIYRLLIPQSFGQAIAATRFLSNGTAAIQERIRPVSLSEMDEWANAVDRYLGNGTFDNLTTFCAQHHISIDGIGYRSNGRPAMYDWSGTDGYYVN